MSDSPEEAEFDHRAISLVELKVRGSLKFGAILIGESLFAFALSRSAFQESQTLRPTDFTEFGGWLYLSWGVVVTVETMLRLMKRSIFREVAHPLWVVIVVAYVYGLRVLLFSDYVMMLKDEIPLDVKFILGLN